MMEIENKPDRGGAHVSRTRVDNKDGRAVAKRFSSNNARAVGNETRGGDRERERPSGGGEWTVLRTRALGITYKARAWGVSAREFRGLCESFMYIVPNDAHDDQNTVADLGSVESWTRLMGIHIIGMGDCIDDRGTGDPLL